MNGNLPFTDDFSLAALRSGDADEFARLVERYSGKIFRLALRILNAEQDAEDVLQETFIKAYKALPKFEERSSIATWLYRIATNEALMLIRKRTPQIELQGDDPDETLDALTAQTVLEQFESTPEQELMSGEVRGILERAVQALSPALRAVFVLRDIEEMSTLQTAQVLNISEAAVKTRLLRARIKLQIYLSQYFTSRAQHRDSND